MIRAAAFACAVPVALAAQSPGSADVWQLWSLGDADKILECAAILDLFEIAPGPEAFPEDAVIDFPAAADAMRAKVQSFHGRDFVARKSAEHSDYWGNATPEDPKVAGLQDFLIACRAFGLAHDLPL
ncbi:hypothetical protein [Primorskyibacter sp. S187A]|uniref:hypothetical protein n=1 Tax=Primorskyibacter sp. S187A TaxID=3415130 RepID=UPI003C7DAB76